MNTDHQDNYTQHKITPITLLLKGKISNNNGKTFLIFNTKDLATQQIKNLCTTIDEEYGKTIDNPIFTPEHDKDTAIIQVCPQYQYNKDRLQPRVVSTRCFDESNTPIPFHTITYGDACVALKVDTLSTSKINNKTRMFISLTQVKYRAHGPSVLNMEF